MSQKDNLFVFAEDDASEEVPEPQSPWHLLVVDDDAEVHSVTRLALANFQFAGRPLEIHSAHSGKEAMDLLKNGPEFVIALVDVVMESDEAGLELVKWIRDDFGDERIRLILRTGQAGNMPQRSIIENYDINDYKEKTDLTANKLFAMLYSSLRAYRDISLLEHKRLGLEHIIRVNHDLYNQSSLNEFAVHILKCVKSLLDDPRNDHHVCTGAFVALADSGSYEALSGTKSFEVPVVSGFEQCVAESKVNKQMFDDCLANESVNCGEDYFLGVITGLNASQPDNKKLIIYCESGNKLEEVDRDLLKIFCENVSVAWQNHISTH